MLKKSFISFLIFTFFVVATSISTAQQSTSICPDRIGVSKSADISSAIAYDESVDLAEIVKFVQKYGLRLEFVEQKFEFAGDILTAWHTFPKNEFIEKMRQRWMRNNNAFFQDTIRMAKQRQSKLQYKVLLDERGSIVDKLEEVQPIAAFSVDQIGRAIDNANTFKVNMIVVSGKQSIFKNLQQSLPHGITSITSIADKNDIEHAMSETATVIDWKKFTPYSGELNCYPSSVSGERYLYLSYQFRDTSGFGTYSGYEHDFFLNDFNGSNLGPGTYLNDSQTLSGFPVITYGVANGPSPYLDTRFLDPDTEKTFTVGLGQGAAIMPNTVYWSYLRTTIGDANLDNAKLSAQLSYQFPKGCTSVWCLFNNVESGSPHRIFQAWNIPIPTGFSWSYTY